MKYCLRKYILQSWPTNINAFVGHFFDNIFKDSEGQRSKMVAAEMSTVTNCELCRNRTFGRINSK